MLSSLINGLQQALDGPWGLMAALAWGCISILLSPCALVLVPMVMGFVSNEDHPSAGRALVLSAAFSSGVFVNLLVVSLPFIIGGAILTPLIKALNWISVVLLLVFGLALLGVLRLPAFGTGAVKARGTGVKGALSVGLFSGLIAGPCAFAFVAPIIALALKVAAEGRLPFAAGLIFCFALGYALVLCLAGVFSSRVDGLLSRLEGSGSGVWMRRICGWIVILFAFVILYKIFA